MFCSLIKTENSLEQGPTVKKLQFPKKRIFLKQVQLFMRGTTEKDFSNNTSRTSYAVLVSIQVSLRMGVNHRFFSESWLIINDEITTNKISTLRVGVGLS